MAEGIVSLSEGCAWNQVGARQGGGSGARIGVDVVWGECLGVGLAVGPVCVGDVAQAVRLIVQPLNAPPHLISMTTHICTEKDTSLTCCMQTSNIQLEYAFVTSILYQSWVMANIAPKSGIKVQCICDGTFSTGPGRPHSCLR